MSGDPGREGRPVAAPTARPTIVPERPVVVLVLRADGSGTVNGQDVDMPVGSDPHDVLMTEACRVAATLGRPVRVTALDPTTEWRLVAHPDGAVTAMGDGRPRTAAPPPPPASRRSGSPEPVIPMTISPDPVIPRAVPPAPMPPRRVTSDPAARRPPAEPRPGADLRPPGEPRPAPGPPPADAPGPSGPRPAPDPRSAGAARQPGPPGPPGGDVSGEPSSRALVPREPRESRRGRARPGTVLWSARSMRSLRAPSLTMVGGIVAAGLLLAAVAMVTLPSDRSSTADRVTTTATASAAGDVAPSPALTKLPLVAPPGFSDRPAWSVPIAAWTRSVAADDGTVLTRTPDGRIVLLDPTTGRVLWRTVEATRKEQDGPWLTSIDGARVVAVTQAGQFSYWRLPASPSASPTPGSTTTTRSPGGPVEERAGVGIALPVGAKVNWIGTSPLVTLPDGRVGTIVGKGFAPVELPAGARPLAADGSTVIAATGSSWVRQPAGAAAASPVAVPRPKGAGAALVRIEPVGSALLLAVWPRSSGPGQVVGLVDVQSGQLVVQTQLAANLDLTRVGVVREVGGTQTLVGSVLVDTYTSNLNLLDPRYRVQAVTRGHAWALLNGKATDIHLNRAGDFTTVAFPAGDAAMPIGVVSAGDGRRATAAVVVPYRDGWVLSGLPPTAPPATSSTR